MSMEKPTLPAARQLADDIRALYAKGLEQTELWGAIAGPMRKLLADPALRERAQGWPATVESAPTVRNLLFYEDPDYGFVFNATVRQPNVVTNVHDHGNVWTLYGLIEGRETMYRYERTDGGPRGYRAGQARVGRPAFDRPRRHRRGAARENSSGARGSRSQHRLHRACAPTGHLPAALLRSANRSGVSHPWAAADRPNTGVDTIGHGATPRGGDLHGVSYAWSQEGVVCCCFGVGMRSESDRGSGLADAAANQGHFAGQRRQHLRHHGADCVRAGGTAARTDGGGREPWRSGNDDRHGSGGEIAPRRLHDPRQLDFLCCGRVNLRQAALQPL